MVYRIVIEKGEDFGYIAHCPAILGCHSQGNTIIIVTHDINIAQRSQRIIHLKDGEIEKEERKTV